MRDVFAGAAIKLLGFKDESELAFEDNVKHSFFLYPDEMVRLWFSNENPYASTWANGDCSMQRPTRAANALSAPSSNQ